MYNIHSFSEQLKVTRLDDKPAIGAKIRVTVARGYNTNEFYSKIFVVTNGLITESIDDATYNSRLLVFKVVPRRCVSKQARGCLS